MPNALPWLDAAPFLAACAAMAGFMRQRRSTPEVFLVGAGPGDPDLLTVAAVKALGRADVVLYDALVGPGILDLAPGTAERVFVGKRSGSHAMAQEAISALISSCAAAGKVVVRLKGGDPMMFGRAGEEIGHLKARGIPVTVIPGITAALGCAASAGLSLTRRGVAANVHFVTAHRCDAGIAPDWSRLADPEGTLCVYMGKEQAAAVRDGLLSGGLDPDTPVLAIENGTRADERRVSGPLSALPDLTATLGGGPTLILIGRAMAEAADSLPHQPMLLPAEA